jgi:hypothetical protein
MENHSTCPHGEILSEETGARKWKLAGEERRSEKIDSGRTRKTKPVTAASTKSRTKS